MSGTEEATRRVIAELRSVLDGPGVAATVAPGPMQPARPELIDQHVSVMLEAMALEPSMRALVWGSQSDALIDAFRAHGLDHVDAVAPGTSPELAAAGYDVLLLDRPTTADAVERAAAALQPRGALVIVTPNPTSLLTRLSVPDDPTEPTETGFAESHPPGPDALSQAVHTSLDQAGMTSRSVRLLFIDAAGPAVLTSEAAANDPARAESLTSLIAAPGLDSSIRATLVGHPREAFEAAFRIGRGGEVADWIMLVAARDDEALAAVLGTDVAIICAYPSRQRAWRSTRTLTEHDAGWLLRPGRRTEPRRSGPLSLHPTESSLAIGVAGEIVLCREIAQSGLRSEATARLVEQWWEAAQTAYAASPPDARQFDVLPRHFVVDASGSWRFVNQETTFRFPIPPAVIALRALHHLLADRLLRSWWIPDVPASSTLRDALATLLELIDLRLDDATLYLWLELEADLASRTGTTRDDHHIIGARLRHAMEAPLADRLRSLPLAEQVKAALVTAAHERGAPMLVELEHLRAELAAARSGLDEAHRAAAELAAESTARHEELEQQRLRIAALEREVESRTQAAHDSRLALDRSELRVFALADELAGHTREREASEARLREASEARLREDRDQAARELRALQRQLDAAKEENATMQRALRIRDAQNRALQIAHDSFDRPVVALRRRLRGPQGGLAERNEIAASSLFDAEWYSAQHPDVADADMDPAMHYLLIGAALGYDPSTRFATTAYLEANPDVAAHASNALLHYLRWGAAEGRPAPAPAAGPADVAAARADADR